MTRWVGCLEATSRIGNPRRSKNPTPGANELNRFGLGGYIEKVDVVYSIKINSTFGLHVCDRVDQLP